MRRSQSSSKTPSISYRLDAGTLYLSESLRITEIDKDKDNLFSILNSYQGEHLLIDLSGLNSIDSSGVAFLQHITYILAQKNKRVELINIPKEIGKIIETFSISQPKKFIETKVENIFEKVGGHTYHFFTVILPAYIYLMGDLFYWSGVDLFKRKKEHRKGEVINQSVLIGVNAKGMACPSQKA